MSKYQELVKRSQGGIQTYILVGPNLRQIENVELERLGLSDRHSLNAKSPRREFLSINRLEKILLSVIGIRSREFISLFLSEELDSLITSVMELSVNKFSIRLDQLVSVTRVSMHVSVSIWNSTIAEQNHNLME